MHFDGAIGKRTLVITGCSKKKLSMKSMAGDLYQGQLFKKTSEFCMVYGYPLMILSAKYGLIAENEWIEPYSLELKKWDDIQKIREKSQKVFKQLLKHYGEIIIVMGKNYRRVFGYLIRDPKVKLITDKRGIGGMLQQLNNLIVKKRGENDRD